MAATAIIAFSSGFLVILLQRIAKNVRLRLRLWKLAASWEAQRRESGVEPNSIISASELVDTVQRSPEQQVSVAFVINYWMQQGILH